MICINSKWINNYFLNKINNLHDNKNINKIFTCYLYCSYFYFHYFE